MTLIYKIMDRFTICIGGYSYLAKVCFPFGDEPFERVAKPGDSSQLSFFDD